MQDIKQSAEHTAATVPQDAAQGAAAEAAAPVVEHFIGGARRASCPVAGS